MSANECQPKGEAAASAERPVRSLALVLAGLALLYRRRGRWAGFKRTKDGTTGSSPVSRRRARDRPLPSPSIARGPKDLKREPTGAPRALSRHPRRRAGRSVGSSTRATSTSWRPSEMPPPGCEPASPGSPFRRGASRRPPPLQAAGTRWGIRGIWRAAGVLDPQWGFLVLDCPASRV